MQTLEQKKHSLFILLSGIFLTNAIIAEMIGVKIFSGEGTLGLAPADPGSKVGATCWLQIKVQGGKFVRSEDPPNAYRCGDGPWQKV